MPINILIFVLGYIILAEVIRRNTWNRLKRDTKVIRLAKSIIIGILYMPSLFLSVHAFIPMPAFMGFIVAFLWPNPVYSVFFQFGVFIVAVSVGTALCYLYFSVKNRALRNGI